jgi:serine kinase of HPr protein (carbohydrate metabolism regulator)
VIELHEHAGLHDDATRGEAVQRDTGGRALAFGWIEHGDYHVRFPGIATFAFAAGAREIRVAAAPATTHDTVEDLFHTAVLPLALQASGHEALHASACEFESGVVAFCGFSGTGKTTVAAGLSARGHRLWADDVVAFSLSARPDVVVLPLPHSTNLRPDARAFLGVVEADPAARPTDMRLAAVVALERAGEGPSLSRLALDAALTALLPHAFCFLAEPGRRERTSAAYLELASLVPVLELRLPAGFDRFHETLDLLESHLHDPDA